MKRPGQVGLMLLMACLLLLGHGAEARTWKAVGTTFAKVFERTPDGNYQGLGVELLREIASRMGDTKKDKQTIKMFFIPQSRALMRIINIE